MACTDSFWGGISTLIGSFLGIAVGSSAGWASWVNMTSVYVILSVVNLLGLWLGVLAFSAKPGCCELEAAPPPLEREEQPNGSTNLLVNQKQEQKQKRGGCNEVTAMLEPYKHGPFMAMFWFNMLQGVGGIVSIYFTQYYMKDVVMASPHGFNGLCSTAEAATSLFGLVQSIAFMTTSLAGGYAADRYSRSDSLSAQFTQPNIRSLRPAFPGSLGSCFRCICRHSFGKKPIVVVSTIGQGLGFAALGFVSDFKTVLGLAVWGGLVAGVGNGAMVRFECRFWG